MLGIKKHFHPLLFQIGNAFSNHFQVFLESSFESPQNMKVPGLAKDSDRSNPRLTQGLEIGILLDPNPGFAGGAESSDTRML